MAAPNSVNILELCHVPPLFNSTESDTEFSLPFTFLDMFWLKFPPVQRLFFYQLTDSTPEFFNSVILPKLKHSLSLTLSHFLPIAGQLIWPSDSPSPVILYTPGDGLVLTVAQSDADMDLLSSYEIIKATELHPYIPELQVSENASSIIDLQITFFPNKGFSIGCSNNHATLDGKSSTMFIKAWSYICKHGSHSLLPELTPIYDRNSIIKDPSQLQKVFLSQWEDMAEDLKTNPRSLKVLPDVRISNDQVRSTFVLSSEDINKLRNKVSSELGNSVSLSSFVLTCAYVAVCMLKAKEGDVNRKFWFVFTADCRSRLDPKLPENYFGNCVVPHDIFGEVSDFMGGNGVSNMAEMINGMIKKLEKEALKGVEILLVNLKKSLEMQGISVAGSHRFGVYGCDFGWGRPKKVDIISIDRTGAIGLTESEDGNGIEIGLVMSRHEMEAFSCLFLNGLKDDL